MIEQLSFYPRIAWSITHGVMIGYALDGDFDTPNNIYHCF